MAVQVRYYTDPACPWSWGTEPKLRKLMWEFGTELEFRWIMGGLARSYGPEYRDDDGRIGSGSHWSADLVAHWLDVSAETGMPCDPRIWTTGPLSSTYPACMAVKAASEQGSEASYRYLRRLREGVMTERRKLDHADSLIAAAAPAGLDVERFGIDIRSHAIVEAFGTDLEEVRDIPEEVRSAGQVLQSEGRERLPFPSAVFAGEGEARQAVWGWVPYERYREAAIAAGATAQADSPAGAAEVIERFRRVATMEVEVLTGRPRPLVEAELWDLAKEWRLRPIPVLTGTLWERA